MQDRFNEVRQLNQQIAELTTRIDSFKRLRVALPADAQGDLRQVFEARIHDLERRVGGLRIALHNLNVKRPPATG